jgi:hypothetical protein
MNKSALLGLAALVASGLPAAAWAQTGGGAVAATPPAPCAYYNNRLVRPPLVGTRAPQCAMEKDKEQFCTWAGGKVETVAGQLICKFT